MTLTTAYVFSNISAKTLLSKSVDVGRSYSKPKQCVFRHSVHTVFVNITDRHTSISHKGGGKYGDWNTSTASN